jgi:hypothetical protein
MRTKRVRSVLRGPVAAVLGSLGALGVVSMTAAPSALASGTTTVNFSNSPTPQSWTAPAGVTQATFDLVGAAGGNGFGGPGAGGETQATITVTPGQTYWMVTGGQGIEASDSNFGHPSAGVGGGAGAFPSGGPGGGATDLRTDPNDATTRLLVAGGGGGGAGDGILLEGTGSATYNGGSGGNGGLNPTGGTAGENFGDPVLYFGGGGGGAATSTAAGTGGSSPSTGNPGQDATGSVGGEGGFAPNFHFAAAPILPGGGGGGGGCLGGGGGGGGLNTDGNPNIVTGGGGGGGGTSCVYVKTIDDPVFNDGINAELGYASVTFPTPQEQQISAQGGQSFSDTEPAAISGKVATFTDPDTNATASEYSASIDWGDGSAATTGTLSGTGGSFSVAGSHTYSDEGSYQVKVTITDIDTASNTATVTDTATVADAPLSAGTVADIVSPTAYSGPVAGFTDGNSSTSSPQDFSATINWGDGTATSQGSVSGSAGSYTVDGSHTYSGTGPFVISTHVVDDGGSSTDTQTKIMVFARSTGGSFVIGDQNAAVGTSVTFWGAQWSKLNSLSGGPAPAGFKGFEDSSTSAGCGTNWSADPGNATPPPTGPLPQYMAVIVSGSITKSGHVIAGDTPHLVVVKTNSGYAPDPAHPGTGTVVAQIC